MRNIFNAMCFRICKGKALWYALFVSLFMGLMVPLLALSEDEINAEVMSGTIDTLMNFGYLIVMFFICIYICGDFRSKTIYYEVMNGHSRSEVYIGRVYAIILFALLLYNVQLIGTLVVSKIILGYNFFADGILAFILKIIGTEVYFVSIIVFIAAASFIGKNIIASIGISWFGYIISTFTTLLNDVTIFGNSFRAYIGSYLPSYYIAMSFNGVQFSISLLCSIFSIIVFYIIGMYSFKKSQLH